MFSFSKLVSSLFLVSLVYAAPIPRGRRDLIIEASVQVADPTPRLQVHVADEITVEDLLLIAPSLEACNATAPFAEECRTAEQAVPFLNNAFNEFEIRTVGEQAAILSLILFETGNLKFDKNHFPAPGNPGQGTRSLMSFPFVHQYAVDTESTSQAALQLAGPDPANPAITDNIKNAVLDLVRPDELSFASAMWFYKESGSEKIGCTANQSLVNDLQAESVDGWEGYITGCVGTTVTPERQALWLQTLAVLRGV